MGSNVTIKNNNPKNVMKLEKIYDLQDKFKKVTNCKTNSSTMQFEVINIRTSNIPQNINFGKNCTQGERRAFNNLFKEYKDIFTCTYDDLNTYYTKIIQHIIPMKAQTKHFHQKLRTMHRSLEPQVKVELNKLLASRIKEYPMDC
jgi:Mg2+ and Co2+ transporter CorA